MSKHDAADDLENAAGAGVQALIERLKSEGVAAGQSEGDAILAKARETKTEAEDSGRRQDSSREEVYGLHFQVHTLSQV